MNGAKGLAPAGEPGGAVEYFGPGCTTGKVKGSLAAHPSGAQAESGVLLAGKAEPSNARAATSEKHAADVSCYTRDQVAEHCFEGDIWIIIRDRVYDVSSFINRHPGGSEIVFDYAGADATNAFESVGHSEDARRLLCTFDIGKLIEFD